MSGNGPWMGSSDGGWPRCVTKRGYLVGLSAIFVSSYSQYFITGINVIAGVFWVYGISIAVIGFICGAPLLRKAFHDTPAAFRIGLASFGVFAVAGSVASLAAAAALEGLDPRALTALHKQLPILDVPHKMAWVMVAASIVVVGPCEEFIFRGFVFGGLLSLFGVRHWVAFAFVSSLLFAVVHLYYAIVYGVAAAVPFIDVLAIGMALAVAYYLSGGNLLIPALIHGVYDATGFLGVATRPEVGERLRGAFILLGAFVAILTILDRRKKDLHRAE